MCEEKKKRQREIRREMGTKRERKLINASDDKKGTWGEGRAREINA